jgi:hypothetical protein
MRRGPSLEWLVGMRSLVSGHGGGLQSAPLICCSPRGPARNTANHAARLSAKCGASQLRPLPPTQKDRRNMDSTLLLLLRAAGADVLRDGFCCALLGCAVLSSAPLRSRPFTTTGIRSTPRAAHTPQAATENSYSPIMHGSMTAEVPKRMELTAQPGTRSPSHQSAPGSTPSTETSHRVPRLLIRAQRTWVPNCKRNGALQMQPRTRPRVRLDQITLFSSSLSSLRRGRRFRYALSS